jgi:arylesterase/paraoxonase
MSIVAVIFSILVALFSIPIYNIIEKGNVFKDVNTLNQNYCKLITANHLEACEDIKIFGRYAYMTCGNIDSRRNWFPPQGRFNISEERNDHVFVMDLDMAPIEPKLMKLVNYAGGDLRLHGLSVFRIGVDLLLFGFINHKRSGSVIEFFRHQEGTDVLMYKTTVSDPLCITTPNSLAITNTQGSFYLTNDHFFNKGWKRKAEEYLQLPLGNVVFYSQGNCRTVLEGLKYPNGIAISTSGKELFVATTTDASVTMYSINQSGSLTKKATVTLDFLLDNINVDSATGHVYVAGHPKLLNYVAYTERESPLHSYFKELLPYSKVVRLVNETGENRYNI